MGPSECGRCSTCGKIVQFSLNPDCQVHLITACSSTFSAENPNILWNLEFQAAHLEKCWGKQQSKGGTVGGSSRSTRALTCSIHAFCSPLPCRKPLVTLGGQYAVLSHQPARPYTLQVKKLKARQKGFTQCTPSFFPIQ